MNEAQAARARYLQRSARTIFTFAPSTSRQLLRESIELDHGGSARNGLRSRDTCLTCGNLMLPEWTVSTRFTNRKVKTSTKGHSQKRNSRHKVRSRRCSMCYRVTNDVATMDSSHIKGDQQLRAAPTARPEEVATEPADPLLEKPVKSSSKKRAKARKDREGLQALLNRSMQAKSTPNLNLMDLMKK